jgi:NADH:ubiquinone oxidoreductase subunit 5 (subunit L)/multisubunit Na+/H+ antiporter MnhA subunit
MKKAHGARRCRLTDRRAWITTTLLMISMILSWDFFVDVGFAHHDVRVPIFTRMTAGDLKVEWSLRSTRLTAVMLVVVNTVSASCTFIPSATCAKTRIGRFFGYLSMFTFAMLMLVTADNLVQLFFGWEGVGSASYLLIILQHKPEANAAAIKASSSIGSAISICARHFRPVHAHEGDRFLTPHSPGARAYRQDD